MDDFLLEMGLSRHEADIYVVLLRKGRQKTGDMIKNTKIVSSQVYSAIASLLDKGLVTYQKTPKAKVYEAVDPKYLKELLSQKQKILETKIPLLRKLRVEQDSPTDTSVYEGIKGFKTALHNMVNSWPEGAEAKIIGFSKQAYKNKQLAELLRDVNKISKQKKHKFRMILDHGQNPFVESRKKEGITIIKYMKKEFISPAAIDICGDTVFILMWDETPYAFSITNKNIATGFHSYFEFMRDMAEKE